MIKCEECGIKITKDNFVTHKHNKYFSVGEGKLKE